jgi:protoporphyrinogen oxidase
MPRTIHVIGAGLAGLAAAVRLSGRGEHVVVHEAMAQAGGRARSYYDASTDLVIDNGNHLLLSGNHAAMAYVQTLGAQAGLVGPPQANFDFIDLPSGKRWKLQIGAGRLPLWTLDRRRRVPDSTLMD